MPAAQSEAQRSKWSPPVTIGEYRVGQKLGAGSMGNVYLAHDTLLDRRVAVKFIAELQPAESTRARFRVEGRALARLQHPNVMAVHRVGEVDEQPYLITELVDGRPLASLALPLLDERVVAVGLDVARGLAAAHRGGVLHRDVKPANVIITDDCAKLIDFGLALMTKDTPSRDLREVTPLSLEASDGTRMAGTPVYMAPEVLRGGAATVHSDIYSLGAMLYELCAGVTPRETLPPGAALEAWIDGVGETLERRVPSVDRRLATVVGKCTAKLAQDRFSSAEAVCDALAELMSRPSLPMTSGNPYRGLAAFEAEHRGVFFGRTAEAHAVVNRLHETALTIVAGDSGIGKSSLCRAGICPMVLEGAMNDGRHYEQARILPGARPFETLVAALSAQFGLDERQLVEDDDPAALSRTLRRSLGYRKGALLLIDQAEELITLADSEQASAFTQALAHLPSRAAGVLVLLALRSDFLARIAAFPGFGDEVNRCLYLLRPLSREGTRTAIIGPAAQRGVCFDPPELVDMLVDSVDPAVGLPLLQFALAELWDSKGETTHIEPRLLATIGGVEGALARHADSVLASLSPEIHRAAKDVLLLLVARQGTTRTRGTATQLGAELKPKSDALDALVRGRLVTVREVAGETAYELTHEALIRNWDTLQVWIAEDGQKRVRLHRIEARAAEWAEQQQTPDLLLTGPRLKDATDLSLESLSERGRAFMRASVAGAHIRRLRRWGSILSAPFAFAIGLFGFAWKQSRDRALIDAHAATASLDRSTGEVWAAAAKRSRERAYGLFDAVDSATSEEAVRTKADAEAAWSEALSQADKAEAAFVRAGQSFEAALALDPGRESIRGAIGDITSQQLVLADDFHVADRRANLVLRLASYDPGGVRQRARAAAPRLTITTMPVGAEVTLERYEDRSGRLITGVPTVLGRTPLHEVTFEAGPGSCRLIFRAAGRVEVRLPLLLKPGESLEMKIDLPAQEGAPPGYRFIPPGRFLVGSADPEPIRKAFLLSPPMYETTTEAFWIGATEITFAQWVEFLNALPPAEREKRIPSSPSGIWAVKLEPRDNAFDLSLTMHGEAITLRSGEPLRFPDRQRRTELRWENLPVTGISMADTEAFFAWQNETGRVAGARPCTEHEWERAARGADGRTFPHGDVLDPEDADFDLTYGRRLLSFGPDEVGSYPAGVSPFGLFDMTGNVYELTVSPGPRQETVQRGGAWYYDSMSAMIVNRTVAERHTRDYHTGFRGCASAR